jgi:hypothetical protein
VTTKENQTVTIKELAQTSNVAEANKLLHPPTIWPKYGNGITPKPWVLLAVVEKEGVVNFTLGRTAW